MILDYIARALWRVDYLVLTPEFFLTAVTLGILVYGLLYTNFQDIATISIVALVGTLILVWNLPVSHAVGFNTNFYIDSLGHYLKSLILVCSIIVIILSYDYSRIEKWHQYEYLVLILLSTISMMTMVSAFDFMTLYLTIELQSLCFYVLAASLRKSEYSVESGLKYFILGALASGIFLYGVNLIYASTGKLCFEDLMKLFAIEPQGFTLGSCIEPVNLGIFLVFVALFFKLTAAPFHLWAPDVYASAPTIITAYFALAPKIAFVGVFLRIGLWTFILNPSGIWTYVLLASATASLILGAFGALAQLQIKRLLAFSSINHVGFILLALALGTQESFEAVFLYIFVYVIMTVGVFGVVLGLRQSRVGTQNILHISDFVHLSKSNPALAFAFSLILFSLAGIPPLAGFISKFYVILMTISASFNIFAGIALFTSCVGCFYYLRIIKIMYFEKNGPWQSFGQMSRATALCISLSLFMLLYVYFFPGVFVLYAKKLGLNFSGVVLLGR